MASPVRHRLQKTALLRRVLKDETAGAAVIFGLALPVLLGSVGVAVDYSMASATRARMQGVADAAAINSAREFQVARATRDSVAAVAQSYVNSQLNDIAVSTVVNEQA